MQTLECLNCHTTGAHRPVAALRVSALVDTADVATAEQFPVGAEIHLCTLCADTARTDIGVTFSADQTTQDQVDRLFSIARSLCTETAWAAYEDLAGMARPDDAHPAADGSDLADFVAGSVPRRGDWAAPVAEDTADGWHTAGTATATVTIEEAQSNFLRATTTTTARPIDPRTGRPVRPAKWGKAKGQAVTWCQCGLAEGHAPELPRVKARRLARLVREADRAVRDNPTSWEARAALARIWSSSECAPAGAHLVWHLDRINPQGALVVIPEHLAPIGTGPTAAEWLAACQSIVTHGRPGAASGLARLAANPYPRTTAVATADGRPHDGGSQGNGGTRGGSFGSHVTASAETDGARQARRLECSCATDKAGKRRHAHNCPVGAAARGVRTVRAARTLRHGAPRRLLVTRPATTTAAVKVWRGQGAAARAARSFGTDRAATLAAWATTCDAAAVKARTARTAAGAVQSAL